MKRKPKKSDKREVKPIPDTPENVAKALFGIKTRGNRAKVSGKVQANKERS